MFVSYLCTYAANIAFRNVAYMVAGFLIVHQHSPDTAEWLLEMQQEKRSIDFEAHETIPFLHRDSHPIVA